MAIVGAGMTGLVAGRELARRGFGVTVLERWPDVGGMASAFDLGGGVYLERYYHHLFRSDAELIGLYDELLPGELEWFSSRVGVYRDGRTWPFVTPMDLLRFGPLSLVDRVRLGVATLRLQRRGDWERMDDVPAIEHLRRSCGDAAVEAVWRPLLLGKFGAEAERVPLSWFASKLVLRRRLRGAATAREELGYPRGSFRRMAMALADEIRRHGGSVRVDARVVRVETAGARAVRIAAPGGYREEAPAAASSVDAEVVLFTTPAFVTAGLADWPADHRAALLSWTYRCAVVLLLEIERPFSATYWTNIADPAVPFLALVEHTNLVPPDRYPHRYLYVSSYVAQDDPLTRMTTAELLAYCLPGLRRIAPGFDERRILRSWSFREPAAQPVPRVGNRRRIMPMETRLPGLYLANTTQIHPEDRGTNYSARLGREAAELIAARHGANAG